MTTEPNTTGWPPAQGQDVSSSNLFERSAQRSAPAAPQAIAAPPFSSPEQEAQARHLWAVAWFDDKPLDVACAMLGLTIAEGTELLTLDRRALLAARNKKGAAIAKRTRPRALRLVPKSINSDTEGILRPDGEGLSTEYKRRWLGAAYDDRMKRQANDKDQDQ